MFQYEIDYGLAGRISVGFEAELGEALIVPHQLGDRPFEPGRDRCERRARQRLFQIFYRVELDTAALEQFQRAARVPSAGVVI
jgi:hypothetical protein